MLAANGGEDVDSLLLLLLSDSDVEGEVAALSTSSDGGSNADVGAAPGHAPMSRRKVTRNASRDRLRKELGALRQETAKLEATLARLKRPSLHSTARVMRRGPVDEGSVWKALEERQRVARKRAELVKRRLCEALQQQQELTRVLMEILRNSGPPQQVLSRWSCEDISRLLPESRPSLDDLLRRAIVIGHQSESAFLTYGSRQQASSKTIRDYDHPEMALEVHSQSTLPFSIEQMTRALWSHWRFADKLEDDYLITSEASVVDDSMKFTFRASTTQRITNHAIVGDGARYLISSTSNEAVFASSSYAIYSASGHAGHGDIPMFRDLWVRVTAAQRPDFCCVEYVSRGSFSLLDVRNRPQSRVSELADLLQFFLEGEIRCSLEGTEAILLHTPRRLL